MPGLTRRPPLIVLVLLLTLLFGVLAVGAHQRYLREDEALAFEGTAGNVITTIQYQMEDVHAPLYFVSFNLWQQVAGDGEFSSRIYSVLLSMLTLALVYQLGRRWSGAGAAWAGVAALLGLGLSAYFYVYAIEIRPYALVMLIAALSMTFFARWLATRRWRYALAWGFTFLMMLYLHYLGTFLFLMQGVYFVLQGKRTWSLWRQAAGTLALVGLLWLPWFPIFVKQVRHIGALVKAENTHVVGLGVAATPLPTTLPTISSLIELMTNTQPLLYAAVLLAGLAVLWRRRLYWLAVAWGVGLPVAMLIVNLIVPIYEPRYASTLVPGFGLLVGLSLAALPGRLKALALLVFAVVGLLTVQTGAVLRVPLRDYLRDLETAFRPGDVAYLDSVMFDNTALYQYRHYAPSVMPTLQVQMPDQPDKLVALAESNPVSPRCIWFITTNWADQAVQKRFHRIEMQRPLQQVIGDERYLFQRLCAPPAVAPRLFGEAMRFRGADIESASRARIMLKLWWDVLSAPTADYSISVQMLNESGALVAQHDGPILDFWNSRTLQTSSLTPGHYYIDHRELVLPPGTPPGRYTLALTVYQPWDGARLPVEGANDAKDNLLTFETVTVPPD
jgi:hypothetical protein